MAIEIFSNASVPRELSTPAIEFLWAKWKTLRGTGALNLQRLMDESRFPLRDNAAFALTTGDDFIYTHVGSNLQKLLNRNLTGVRMSTSASIVVKEMQKIYLRAVSEITPAFTRFTYPTTPGRLWQQIILPVPLGDDTTIIVSYSDLVSYEQEVYEHLFRTASDAMLIAAPITNDAGHVIDGWIIMMNDRARDILNVNGTVGNRRLAEFSQFDSIDLWGRIYAPRPAAGAAMLSGPAFDIEVLRFPHVFGLRMRPKSGLPMIESAPIAAAIAPVVQVEKI